MAFRRCRLVVAASIHDIRAGRQVLAQQFAGMDGWQSGADTRFDAYVEEQRRREAYEGFDQRVERAFTKSAALHKAEVINGYKRQLTSTKTKFTSSTLREMNQAVEGRMEWLREVWTQIDSDYRSNDVRRQEAAAEEISKALRGEASDFMAMAYEKKQSVRFLGPKGKMADEAVFEDSNFPEISENEANRYLNLKMDMNEVERQVKSKYGIAGATHWAMLQSLKDADYEDKLDRAAEQYKELLDQQNRFDESTKTTQVRTVMERTHTARVRFQAAMEMEEERERMLEAHQAMKEERKKEASEKAKLQLREAAELRAQGKTTSEVAAALKLHAWHDSVKKQDEYRFAEQQTIMKKKETFLHMIESMRRESAARDGAAMMAPNRTARRPLRASTATLEASPEELAKAAADCAVSSSSSHFPTDDDDAASARAAAQRLRDARSQSDLSQRKKELWRSIHGDTYEDPFLAVHQARVDAERNYDPTYAKMNATELAIGPKYGRQGTGADVAGNESDRHILQKGNDISKAFQWGNPHGIIHNLDGDGSREYFLSDVYHVRDRSTGDIDWRHERRAGGPMFSGPRFYKPGERRESMDPGNKPVDPSPIPTQSSQKESRSHPGGRSRRQPNQRSE